MAERTSGGRRLENETRLSVVWFLPFISIKDFSKKETTICFSRIKKKMVFARHNDACPSQRMPKQSLSLSSWEQEDPEFKVTFIYIVSSMPV